MVLTELRRTSEALDCFDIAVQLEPSSSICRLNRGSCLQKLGDLTSSENDIRYSLCLDPQVPEACNVLGLILQEAHDFDFALRAFNRAVLLNPTFADGHFNRSLVQLTLGNFLEGAKGFEWRWHGPLKKTARNFSRPLWLGEFSIRDKVLLVASEQGLGDAIQYARYLPLLAQLAKRVVVEAPEPLIPLISTIKGSFEWVARGKPLPEFEAYCPLMSLDLAFKTDLSNIPNGVPYLSISEENLIHWRNRLGVRRCPRIGFVWKGNPLHVNDHNRSLPFEMARRILAVKGYEFHVLQKDMNDKDRKILSSMGEVHLHGDRLEDLTDTAAIIQEMDLTISVDTSIAHLAGALGRPVWILLPYLPDFRWMMDSQRTPWYPTARLFRQTERKEWGSVVEAVNSALKRDEWSVS